MCMCVILSRHLVDGLHVQTFRSIGAGWMVSVECQAGPGLIHADGYECALIPPWVFLFSTPAVLEMLNSQRRRKAGCFSSSWLNREVWVKESQRPEDLPAWLFPGYLIFCDNHSHIKFGQYLLMTRNRVGIIRTKILSTVGSKKHVIRCLQE